MCQSRCPQRLLDFQQNQRCTLFPCLCSSPFHSAFLSLLLALEPFKPPPLLIRQRQENVPLFVSLFLSLPLTLSSSLIRYTDSSFNGRHLVQSALSCFLASRSISDHSFLIKYSCNINSHEYLLLGVQGNRQICANMSSSEGTAH